MDDRAAARAGVVLAGLALVAAVLQRDTAGVGPVENATLAALAALALVAFSLRRHDLLARGPGALVAGLASAGVVGYVVLTAGALAGGASGSARSWGPVALALAGGLGGVIAAYGDGRGVPASVGRTARAAAWGLGVGFAGLFAIAAWGSLLLTAVAAVVPGDPGTTARLVVSTVALGLGTGTVALVYFQWTDRALASLDVRPPTRRDVGYAVGGVVALLGLQFAVSAAFSWLGVPTADHSVQESVAGGNAEVLLLLVPASFLIVGPGEELLYRNVIQRDLYDTFGEWGAVLVASGVFALAHIPAYVAGASLPALLNALVVIFLLSVVLGVVYLATENLLVPIFVHGGFDAVVFALMYLQMVGGA